MARESPSGQLGAGVFLVDLGCLGVKSAFANDDMGDGEYRQMLDVARQKEPLVRCELSLAVKVIRAGLEYARDLGFSPDRDFAWARYILGGGDPGACAEEVECGRDGKPVYVAGPYDDVRRIVRQLERRLGKDGFRFVVPSDVHGPMVRPVSRAPKDLGEGLDRTIELKEALIAFALSDEMQEEWEHFRAEGRDTRHAVIAEAADAMEVDSFLSRHRLEDGGTVIDGFMDQAQGLSAWDRGVLERWKESFLGTFEVLESCPDHVRLLGLLDDLEYEVRSNVGPDKHSELAPGEFLLCRIAPFGDAWIFSGHVLTLPGSEHEVCSATSKLAIRRHDVVYRNPELLERARELQELYVANFERLFGGPEIIVAGEEVGARLRELNAAHIAWAREPTDDADAAPGDDVPHIELAPSIRRAATAGILCDSKWGTNIFVDYGVLDELFAHPTRLKRSLPREVLVGYLRSESVSPQPFEHLARRYPQGANEVFAALLHKPEFDWERDGQAVLEAMKPRYYEREPLPDVTVLSERISAGLRERS